MLSGHGMGNRSSTCTLAEYGTTSGLMYPQPKPGSQVHNCTVLLGVGVGWPSGDALFGSVVVAGLS